MGFSRAARLTSMALKAHNSLPAYFSPPFADEDSTIRVSKLVSRQYLEMTLEVMDNWGISYSHEQNEGIDTFKIPANQCIEGRETIVDGDWSSAATLLTLGALCGSPKLEVTEEFEGHTLKLILQ